MAHNLATDAVTGEAAMFYRGEMPWHRLGQKVDEYATIEVALKKSHLDYDVKKIPLVAKFPSLVSSEDETISEVTEDIAVEDKVGVIRTDTKQLLGVVGTDYHVVQNKDAFGFFDAIVGEGQAIYETAGALGKGENIWIMAKLPKRIELSNKDNMECYLLLWNSHDGTSAIRARFTPVRVVCQNTLRMAFSGGKADEVRIRHTMRAEERLKEAHQLLGIVSNQMEESTFYFEKMLKKEIGFTDVKDFLAKLMPVNENAEFQTRRNNVCAEITKLFSEGKGNSGKTVWDLYNGVTEYVDHFKSVKNNANRWQQATWGVGDKVKKEAFELACEMSK